MTKAIWEGVVLAESEQTVEIEGNQYFPPQSILQDYFKPGDSLSICPWYGRAGDCHIEVNGKQNMNAAWYYPEPKSAAQQIKDHVAFWKGVKVQK